MGAASLWFLGLTNILMLGVILTGCAKHPCDAPKAMQLKADGEGDLAVIAAQTQCTEDEALAAITDHYNACQRQGNGGDHQGVPCYEDAS